MTDARRITRALGGRWWSGGYGTAPCPAHDDRRPSLSLADAQDGRLLARCHAGCDWPAILDALRARGLVASGGASLKAGEQANPDTERRRTAERAEAERKAAQAARCWAEAGPIADSLAERYLRRRGITAPLGAALRFHPACWHGPTARRWPALVACVEGTERFAIHRTYLAPDGSGKAPVEPAKMMLGATAGGAARLANGPAGGLGPLVVAEGIETALSLASGLLPGPLRLWAALSASGMAALRLPPFAAEAKLIVAADGDAAGRAAAHALAERAHALRWPVWLLPAPEGQDWNDALRGRAAA